MPTYEYECQTCKHRFEEFQSITAEPLEQCPECRERSLRRLIGKGGGVIFKGSGFYVNDYARKGAGGAAAKKGADAKPPCAEGGKCDPGAAA
jgi:putative FmdB family regulatory protein